MDVSNKLPVYQFEALYLRGHGRFNDAENIYRQQIKQNPDNPQAHFALGVSLFYDNGLKEEAIQEYQEAIRLKPDWALVHFNLALAFDEIGYLEKALTELNEVLRISPQFAAAKNKIGEVYKRQGNYSAAVVAFHEAINLQPNSMESLLNLGLLLCEMEQTNEGMIILQNLAKKMPNHPKVHYVLGQALSAIGQRQEAIAEWQKVISLIDEATRDRPKLPGSPYDPQLKEQAKRMLNE